MLRMLLYAGAAAAALLAALVAGYLAFPDLALQVGRRVPRLLAGLSARSVTAAGHRIVYLEGGSGEPLVLLHGFGGDKDGWPPLARRLTAHFHLYVLDLPGFGESTRDPAARYGFAEQAERVAAFAQAVGIARPFHIGGNSMGGAIAGVFAARHPERVKTLWLIDPAGVTSATRSEVYREFEAGRNPLVVAGPQDFDALMGLLFVHPPWIPPRLAAALARARAAHRDFDAKVFQDLRDSNLSLEKELRGSTVPTLITWGDRDRVVDVSGAALLAAAMLQARLDIQHGVGHVPMMEQPDDTAARYLAFQRSLGR